MKIKSVYSYLHKLPLTKPYTIAYKTITDTKVVFLEITLENGVIGIGAASPSADVVGETPEQTLANLQSGYLDELVGKDIRGFNSLVYSASNHFKKLPGSLAAIDIALHDLFCKYLNIPVLDFYGRQKDNLATSVTIGIKEINEMLGDAGDYYKLGFRILKIKTGIDVDADIERVTKLSDTFNNKMLIRVDANQGYTISDLEKFIKNTSHLGLELIEQPVKVGQEYSLSQLTEKERKLLAADESLLDPVSAWELSNPPQPFGIYNIKLMKCGGISAAREIAIIAKNAGIDLFWGCNDESIISITAALHAAYSCNNTKYLDLDGSFDLAKDLVEGGFKLKDGYMYPTELPGLGFRKI
ncbi:MAG TPA: dipeptide epimerase [Mucilaginibacter sp.]|jgi:L-alanine-DL-glutamate epimerase-like enolase superfamily enzyme